MLQAIYVQKVQIILETFVKKKVTKEEFVKHKSFLKFKLNTNIQFSCDKKNFFVFFFCVYMQYALSIA